MVWQGSRSYEQREFEHRVTVLITCCIFLFFILVFRLFYLQVIRGKYYWDISESNRTQIFFQRAARGTIYDTNREVIADHRPTFVVLFSPLKLSEEVFEGVLRSLERILDIPMEKLLELVGGKKKRSIVIRLADEISRAALFRILEMRPDLPGVTITFEPARRYPFGAWAAHFIGYLGEINPRELSARIRDGYKQGDVIGKTGVEKVYDYYLRGESGGMQLEVDAGGKSQRILYNIPPIPGNDMILNIDRHIQQAGEEMFRKSDYTGAAVAIDPFSGNVLALISSPNYDPNVFLKPIGEEKRGELFLSEKKYMFNRALQGQYALGSVYKIITMCAALETGSELAARSVLCKGKYKLGRRVFKCWKKKGHGRVDISDALTYSCDVYFYQLGLSAGIEPIADLSRIFGLGAVTGIDLPSEKAGLVPDADWKKNNRRESWYDGDTVNLSIGQGYLLVTPLQVANLIAAVASQGKLYRPNIVAQVVSAGGKILFEAKRQLIRNIHMSSETWEMLDAGLKSVVETGTGRACRIKGLNVTGKTGTVQNPHGDDHAWFAAYASLPGSKPRIAVAVLVEHGLHGATAAAPIAREMIKAAFPELKNAG